MQMSNCEIVEKPEGLKFQQKKTRNGLFRVYYMLFTQYITTTKKKGIYLSSLWSGLVSYVYLGFFKNLWGGEVTPVYFRSIGPKMSENNEW